LNVILKNGDKGSYANLSEKFFKLRSIVVIFTPQEADRLEIERKKEFGEIKEGDFIQEGDKVIQCLSETDRGKRFYKTLWQKNRPFVYGIGRFNLNRLRGDSLSADKVAFFVGVNLPSSPYFGNPVELVRDLLKKGNTGKPSIKSVATIFGEPWYKKILTLDIGKGVMDNLDKTLEDGAVTWRQIIENYYNVASDPKHKDVVLANDRLVALLKDKENRDLSLEAEKRLEKSFKNDMNKLEQKTIGEISDEDTFENPYLTMDEETVNELDKEEEKEYAVSNR
jgi:hypothetical protein